jgi:CheY-like chemotaxis protein
MNKNGPIIVIEDDIDDQEILVEIFTRLNYKNELIYFRDGNEALEFLNDTHIQPFLILSDINMPKLNGLELKEKVHNNEDLRLKCIPFLFFTTTASERSVVDAYSKSVQGFFVKPDSIEQLEATIQRIVEYWQECISPNYIK